MAKKNETETAMVRLDPDDYPALTGGVALTEVLEENLAGERITPFDLDNVTVPAGGGQRWQMADDDVLKELTGVVVYQVMGRSFWNTAIDEGGGGNPPDCFSPDGVHGYGLPDPARPEVVSDESGADAFLCETCPNAQFGSAAKGRGQACKQVRVVYLLRPGEMLPTIVRVPPTSLKAMKRYLMRLGSRGLRYFEAVTSLGLEKATNQDKVDYSRIVPKLIGPVPESAREAVREYHEKISESFRITPAVVAGLRNDEG